MTQNKYRSTKDGSPPSGISDDGMRWLRHVAALLCLALLLAACGGGEVDAPEEAGTSGAGADDATSSSESSDEATPQAAAGETACDWQAAAPPEWQEVLKAGREEGQVVVAGPGELAEGMATAFKEDTGIDLQYASGQTAELTGRLVREAQENQLTTDLLLSGAGELLSMKPEGLLAPLKPQMILPNVTDPANWQGGEMRWSDEEGQYLFEGARFVSGIPVVNADIIDPASITSWNDLLSPEYKGKIATYDPRAPGPGQATASYVADDLGIEFLTDLYVSQEMTYTRDLGQLTEWITRGTYPIGLAVGISFLVRFQEQGLNIQAVVPEDSPGFTTGGFSVLKQAAGDVPNPNAATVFINWYASCAGSSTYTEIKHEPSNRVDVSLDGVPAYAIPDPDVDYVHQYEEDWYVNVRPRVSEAMIDAIGR